jgi:hypothetical protein
MDKLSPEEQQKQASLEALLARVRPGARLVSWRELGPDDSGGGGTAKGFGYGRPVRMEILDSAGRQERLVLHTAKPDQFGHDRPSDRARDMLLARETFGLIPGHVGALEVGAITERGLLSLEGARDYYLLTTYAEGEVYAEDLRKVARERVCSAEDRRRARALGVYLAELHRPVEAPEAAYLRSVRTLVGSSEGIFGIIDGYPEGTPMAPPSRLQAIEARCQGYRWRLRGRAARRRRVHGDFHPFNVVFSGGGALALLDASRGCVGDPADDVTCLAVNYLFFALETPGSWGAGFEPLLTEFFEQYLDRTGDTGLAEVAPPFLAWRALVISNPLFFPSMAPATRDHLLTAAERALDEGRWGLDEARRWFPR